MWRRRTGRPRSQAHSASRRNGIERHDGHLGGNLCARQPAREVVDVRHHREHSAGIHAVTSPIVIERSGGFGQFGMRQSSAPRRPRQLPCTGGPAAMLRNQSDRRPTNGRTYMSPAGDPDTSSMGVRYLRPLRLPRCVITRIAAGEHRRSIQRMPGRSKCAGMRSTGATPRSHRGGAPVGLTDPPHQRGGCPST